MKEKEVLDENQRPIMGTDGKPKTEQVEVTVPHFKAVTVFDIAQTSGEPIQTLAPELLTAAVQDFDSFMQAIQKISPVPIRFDEIDGNANGYYHNADKEIVIKKGLSESQTLKTAIHETAHAKLHDREIMESLGVEKDRLTKEVEAESVAYCVCSSFDLDTSDYSFPYIAGWSSSREMKEMKASMDVIRKTAGEMIDQLTEELGKANRDILYWHRMGRMKLSGICSLNHGVISKTGWKIRLQKERISRKELIGLCTHLSMIIP